MTVKQRGHCPLAPATGNPAGGTGRGGLAGVGLQPFLKAKWLLSLWSVTFPKGLLYCKG